MTTLFTNWHFMRILRAGIATYAFIEVYRTGDWMLFAIGSIFALQAIFDIGCCGAAGCAPNQTRNSSAAKTEDITYEEVR